MFYPPGVLIVAAIVGTDATLEHRVLVGGRVLRLHRTGLTEPCDTRFEGDRFEG